MLCLWVMEVWDVGAAGFASRVWELLDSGGVMALRDRDRHKI